MRGFKQAALIINSAATTISMRTQAKETNGDREQEFEEFRTKLKQMREEQV